MRTDQALSLTVQGQVVAALDPGTFTAESATRVPRCDRRPLVAALLAPGAGSCDKPSFPHPLERAGLRGPPLQTAQRWLRGGLEGVEGERDSDQPSEGHP